MTPEDPGNGIQSRVTDPCLSGINFQEIEVKIEAIVLACGLALLSYGFTNASMPASGKSQAEKLFARATPDDYMNEEACGECHSRTAKAFGQSPHAALVSSSKLPLDKKGCQGCHGPGRIHQAEENAEVISFRAMTPKESSAACLRCHAETLNESHWKKNQHAQADLSCVSCHQIHPSSDPAMEAHAPKKGEAKDPKSIVFTAKVDKQAMLKADEATLCGSCHQMQVGEFRQSTHHPVPEGSMVCSDCHNPHPSKASKSHKDASKDSCVKCHTEMAGPFLYEHDPVSGSSSDGCKECHKPHGANNPKMLNSVSRGLCAQCHTDKLATHYPNQTCWTAGCHVANHGSNTSPRFLAP